MLSISRNACRYFSSSLATAALCFATQVFRIWSAAAFTFALHVALDKGELSEANARRARAVVAECARTPEGRSSLALQFGEDAARFVDAFMALRHERGAKGVERLKLCRCSSAGEFRAVPE